MIERKVFRVTRRVTHQILEVYPVEDAPDTFRVRGVNGSDDLTRPELEDLIDFLKEIARG